jgi:hypothetical protein
MEGEGEGEGESGKTFVSSHYRVDEEAIKQYLERKNINFRTAGIIERNRGNKKEKKTERG